MISSSVSVVSGGMAEREGAVMFDSKVVTKGEVLGRSARATGFGQM
jgi:hypothetical protein